MPDQTNTAATTTTTTDVPDQTTAAVAATIRGGTGDSEDGTSTTTTTDVPDQTTAAAATTTTTTTEEPSDRDDQGLLVDCEDTDGYTDARGKKCLTWKTRDCVADATAGNFSTVQIESLLYNCPRSCGSCIAGCRDTLFFKDAKNRQCTDWEGLSCLSASSVYGYTPSEQSDIVANCAESCRMCDSTRPCSSWDDVSYRDPLGNTCSYWMEKNCDFAQLLYGYTEEQMHEIHSSCPQSCGTCNCVAPKCQPVTIVETGAPSVSPADNCTAIACGALCGTELGCGWSSQNQRCQQGSYTTSDEMAAGTCPPKNDRCSQFLLRDGVTHCECATESCDSCRYTNYHETCIACGHGQFLMPGGECVDSCGSMAAIGIADGERQCVAPYMCQGGLAIGQDKPCSCPTEGCSACQIDGTGSYCSECNEGFFVYRGTCRTKCPAWTREYGTNYVRSGKFCIDNDFCEDGTVHSDGATECECADNCQECKGFVCRRCSSGLLLDGSCVDACPEYMRPAVGDFGRECVPPVVCSAGSTENGTPCSCPQGCTQCELPSTSGNAICLACDSASVLQDSNCVGRCPPHHVHDPAQDMCVHDEENCQCSRIDDMVLTSPSGRDIRVAVATFGPTENVEAVFDAEVAFADPVDACHGSMLPAAAGAGQITNDIKGKIVLIRRGTCKFVTKARNAEAAGAIGVVIYDTEISHSITGNMSILGGLDDDIDGPYRSSHHHVAIPTVMANFQDVEPLINEVRSMGVRARMSLTCCPADPAIAIAAHTFVGQLCEPHDRVCIRSQTHNYGCTQEFASSGALSALRCSKRGLHWIPNVGQDFPPVPALDLHNNFIGSIRTSDFIARTPASEDNLHAVRRLDLSLNALTSVAPFVLRRLPELEYLDLRNNPLSTLPKNALAQMTRLMYLYFDAEVATTLLRLPPQLIANCAGWEDTFKPPGAAACIRSATCIAGNILESRRPWRCIEGPDSNAILAATPGVPEELSTCAAAAVAGLCEVEGPIGESMRANCETSCKVCKRQQCETDADNAAGLAEVMNGGQVSSCAVLEASGACKASSPLAHVAEQFCPSTCGVCRPICHHAKDDYGSIGNVANVPPSCDAIKLAGGCEQSSVHHRIAMRHCATTCNVCTHDCENNDAMLRQASNGTGPSSCDSIPVSACEPTSEFYSIVSEHCPRACGLCPAHHDAVEYTSCNCGSGCDECRVNLPADLLEQNISSECLSNPLV